jgi:hypothetical protein
MIMALSSLFIKRPENADMSRKIVAALQGVNDEITDAAMKAVAGDVTSSSLRAAFRELARADPPVLFRRIRNHGWKRMHDPDIVAHSEVDLKKIARGARRGRKRLGAVRFDALSSNDQLQAARNNTRFAAIEDASVNATVRRKPASSIPDLETVLKKIKGDLT